MKQSVESVKLFRFLQIKIKFIEKELMNLKLLVGQNNRLNCGNSENNTSLPLYFPGLLLRRQLKLFPRPFSHVSPSSFGLKTSQMRLLFPPLFYTTLPNLNLFLLEIIENLERQTSLSVSVSVSITKYSLLQQASSSFMEKICSAYMRIASV